MMYKLQPVLNKIVELGDDILPKSVLSTFKRMQKEVNRFVKYNPKNKSLHTKKGSGGTSGKAATTNKKKSVEGGGGSGNIGDSGTDFGGEGNANPPETYRDSNGRLRNKNGTFAKDPNTVKFSRSAAERKRY